jgi:hypothetical protein
MQLYGRIVTVPAGVGAEDGASDVGCDDGYVLGSALGDGLGNSEGLDVGGPFTHTFVDVSPEAVSPYDVACHSATTDPDAGGVEGAYSTKL